jgi:sodium pump decarboxylase gamma subunit
MANLQVGLQLMIIGLGVVFLVLLLLMFIMKIMSALVHQADVPQLSVAAPVSAANTDDAELAVVIAVVTGMVVDGQGGLVQIHVSQAK